MYRIHRFYIPFVGVVSASLCSAIMLLMSPLPAAACELPALPVPFVEKQVLNKAAQGWAPFKDYIHRNRMIYQLDLVQTVRWLDDRRAAEAECARVKANPNAAVAKK